LLALQSTATGDFPAFRSHPQFDLRSRQRRAKQIIHCGKRNPMNVETTESKAVEQATKVEADIDVLTLSLGDLDLVAGGAVIGSIQ
jgi:hypothetical protein